jgi:hypothetical protein
MKMSAAEVAALADVRGYASANRVRFSFPHAYDRMAERGASEADVVHALRTAQGCRLQNNGRFKVYSADLDGDEIKVIVELDRGDDYVITVF